MWTVPFFTLTVTGGLTILLLQCLYLWWQGRWHSTRERCVSNSSWLVVLRICVTSVVFQPYRDLEAGDNQSLKFNWQGGESNPGTDHLATATIIELHDIYSVNESIHDIEKCKTKLSMTSLCFSCRSIMSMIFLKSHHHRLSIQHSPDCHPITCQGLSHFVNNFKISTISRMYHLCKFAFCVFILLDN